MGDQFSLLLFMTRLIESLSTYAKKVYYYSDDSEASSEHMHANIRLLEDRKPLFAARCVLFITMPSALISHFGRKAS